MKLLGQLARPANDLKVVVLGLTFKENVPDLRNSKVLDVIQELREYGVQVLVMIQSQNRKRRSLNTAFICSSGTI